jgi:hypothetical protein
MPVLAATEPSSEDDKALIDQSADSPEITEIPKDLSDGKVSPTAADQRLLDTGSTFAGTIRRLPC